MTKSTRDEAIAGLVRETGRPIEYFEELTPYWLNLLFGWKPKPDEKEVDRRNRELAAKMAAMMRQGPANRGK